MVRIQKRGAPHCIPAHHRLTLQQYFLFAEYALIGFGRSGSKQISPNYNEKRDTMYKFTAFDGKQVKQVAAGEFHSAILLENGTVYTWGSNT